MIIIVKLLALSKQLVIPRNKTSIVKVMNWISKRSFTLNSKLLNRSENRIQKNIEPNSTNPNVNLKYNMNYFQKILIEQEFEASRTYKQGSSQVSCVDKPGIADRDYIG